MMTRLSPPRGLFVFLTSILFTVAAPQFAGASSRTIEDCTAEFLPIKSDTLKSLRDRNTEALNRYISRHPMSGFNSIADEVKIEQAGEIAPRALQQILGDEYKVVSSPAPSAPANTAVNQHEEGKSLPIHIDINWQGRRTSTTLYASLPKTLKPRGHQYLVGPEYPAVLFHLHGGGTPTATGKNAMSIAQALAGENIPVLAPDLPGHGRATRQLDGLMSAQEQADWILEIVKKTVHPNVKVLLSGHSWGGEFAEFMYRHSNDPKYAQIALFFVLSAPVDVSLGGDEKLKYEWDEYYERNYKEFEARIAPADFEFQSNSHYHGKISETGSYFTYATHMDFSTPPLSPDEQRKLKPKIVVVGNADGLVYVGAEKQYDTAHSNLIAPSRYILMGERQNWKSAKEGGKLYPTGHNIWDAYKQDGSGKYEVYSLIQEEVLKAAGGSMGADDGDPAAVMLSNYRRQYDNNFIFRQMVQSGEEYVMTPTNERTNMGKRKQELETYINGASSRDSQNGKETDAKVQKALEPLRKELGLPGNFTVDRAKQEYAMPELTAERKAELEAYLAATAKVEENLRNGGNGADSEWDGALAAMGQEFAATLKAAGVADINQYAARFQELDKRKSQLNAEEKSIHSNLTRLHQKYIAATKARQSRFGARKNEELAKLKAPEGVTDFKSAQRELAPDRKSKDVLTSFIDRASQIEADVRAQAVKEMNGASGEALPSGITNVDQAKAERDEILAREEYTYAPANNQSLQQAAKRVKDLLARRQQLIKGPKGLDALEKEAKDLFGKRASLAKSWEGLWKKGVLTSARLREFEAAVNRDLELYKDLYFKHEHLKGEWMRGLKKSGQLTQAILLVPPAEMTELRNKYQAAKAEFEKKRDQIENVRWEEALAGRLEGPESAVQSAVKAARELWGESTLNPSQDSIVVRARIMENALEVLRSTESVTRQELERAQYNYSQGMIAAGEKLPFTVTRVVIRDMLDLDYNVLVERLRADSAIMSAFQNLLNKYNAHLKLLRVEAQSKDAGNY